jgi:hypothetical protein
MSGVSVPPPPRRRRVLLGGVVVLAALLIVITIAGTRDSGDGETTFPALGVEPTTTTATVTVVVPMPTATPTTMPVVVVLPIDVNYEIGAARIAGHIVCHSEDELTGDSVDDVRAAVAADNNSGGGAKPYAYDAEAQSEIVRASVQELGDAGSFYADCEPAPTPGPATVTPASQSSSVDGSEALPATP